MQELDKLLQQEQKGIFKGRGLLPYDKKENQIFEILLSDEIKQTYDNYYKQMILYSKNKKITYGTENQPNMSNNPFMMYNNMEMISKGTSTIESILKKMLVKVMKNPLKVKSINLVKK